MYGLTDSMQLVRVRRDIHTFLTGVYGTALNIQATSMVWRLSPFACSVPNPKRRSGSPYASCVGRLQNDPGYECGPQVCYTYDIATAQDRLNCNIAPGLEPVLDFLLGQRVLYQCYRHWQYERARQCHYLSPFAQLRHLAPRHSGRSLVLACPLHRPRGDHLDQA